MPSQLCRHAGHMMTAVKAVPRGKGGLCWGVCEVFSALGKLRTIHTKQDHDGRL
jgi:hypothetical protein